MYLAVLDYASSEVVCTTVDESIVVDRFNGDVERFLSAPEKEGGLGLDLGSVSWMYGEDIEIVINIKKGLIQKSTIR